MNPHVLLPMAVAALLAAAPAPAHGQAPQAAPAPPPPIAAFRLDAPVELDGSLADPAWRRAPSLTRLVQADPVEGLAPSESTWVWVAFDDQALYVAARCWDSRPDSIVANLVRRDRIVPSDRFMLYLDPFRDRRSGYYFGLSAAGVLLDGTLFNDQWDEDSWDGVWSGRTRRDDRGWTLEMRVPFSQLRFRPGAEQVWGINFKRRIERRLEQDYLVYTPKKGSGFVSRFPELTGISNGHRSTAIEVLPYLTGKGEFLVRDAGDPFYDGSRLTPGLGGDLRMGVGNSLTLNATANPDFGQVEVDPAVVNLSDVETYFQEKRPFFTENGRVFSFGNEGANDYWGFNWPEPTFFYSRRIGRAPQGGLPDGSVFRDVPVATHILGAAKLTGKLGSSVNFGALSALTARETARFGDRDGLRGRTEVEPLTYYGVMRGLKEFREARNGLGVMANLIQRSFDGGATRATLDRQSIMTGLDGWHFLDHDKLWALSGWAVATRLAGTREEILAQQSSSRRYLQRPDRGHWRVDGDATSLSGLGGRLWLNKQRGNLLANSAIGFMTPGFDVNDLGFLSRADIINAHLGGGRSWTTPGRVRRYAHWIGALYGSRDFDGNTIADGLWTGGRVEFLSNRTIDASGSVAPQTMNNRRTRGGPLTLNRPSGQAQVTLASDTRRLLSSSVTLYADFVPETRSGDHSVELGLTWKPRPNLSITAGPGLDRNIQDAQYVATVPTDRADLPAEFGGNDYVFARMDQSTVYAAIRFDVSFSPTMSLQTYLQPLISAGRYEEFKTLARARSYEFVSSGAVAPYGLADPSFNFKSLRGNAVFRWEYRPGSVLYLVWTQERTDAEDTGELRFGPSTRRLLDARANDIFLVKATYHLDL